MALLPAVVPPIPWAVQTAARNAAVYSTTQGNQATSAYLGWSERDLETGVGREAPVGSERNTVPKNKYNLETLKENTELST